MSDFIDFPPSDFAPIDFRTELNDEQYAAVTSDPGPALVLSGAGSGKTRILTYRVAHLLQAGIRPYEILLLTFTNKAAREMLERVENLTGIPRRQFWGGTFHSVAQRILRIHGEKIGLRRHYTILDQSEGESLLKNAVEQIDPNFIKTKHWPKPRVLADTISYARNACANIAEEADKRFLDSELSPKIAAIHLKYQTLKMEQQVVDYDDLLEYLLKLLREHRDIAEIYRKRFKHILVDEFQDTNRLQSEIVDFLGEHHQIMAVGDDAQCIYTWRGANFDNIMRFEERHQETVIHKIVTNYRSTPQILDFANAVLRSQPAGSGYRKELKAVKASGPRPLFVPLMDAREQADFIIRRIESLVDEGRHLREIAVLYRAHYQAMELQMELTRRNIHYRITSGVRFFEQAHIKDFSAQLRFASNPTDVFAFTRFTMLLPKIGPKTAQRIHTFTKELAEKETKDFFDVLNSEAVLKKVPKDAQEQWPSLTETVSELYHAMRKEPPSEVVKIGLDGWYGSFIREIYPNWAEREDDLKSLVAFADRYETMEEMLAQLVLLASENSDHNPEEDKDCLRLTTVHQAKGLEFPVVFIIGLTDGLFPLERTIREDDVEEERRIFYVAVTRAMEELYMSYPIINRRNNHMIRMPPSRFVQGIDSEHYETSPTIPSQNAWR